MIDGKGETTYFGQGAGELTKGSRGQTPAHTHQVVSSLQTSPPPPHRQTAWMRNADSATSAFAPSWSPHLGQGAGWCSAAIAELRPVRHQSGVTHSGSLLLQGQ